MGIRINTNIPALNTRRHITNTTNQFNKSMEKLSSGLRINRAADDAAGLAISEGLKSDIRALEQASRNASDGISLVQTAEGALDEVSNILLRMKELAEQSLNGTLSDTERGYLDAEYTALTEEIDRVAASTEFNGIELLSGGGGSISIQVGIGTATTDSIAIDLSSNRDSSTLTLAAGIGNATDAATAMGQVDAAIQTVSGARADFGAIQNRLESSIRNINNTAENLSAANSRIRDVDMAMETSRMTSYQILQQAGVSVLAQANLTSGLALSLLS
ncbi:MAG: flagellin [Candidatus Krumholzibacteria bacterium]|nr:flagellin [Candidatus Krumholzibacteria bacterium]